MLQFVVEFGSLCCFCAVVRFLCSFLCSSLWWSLGVCAFLCSTGTKQLCVFCAPFCAPVCGGVWEFVLFLCSTGTKQFPFCAPVCAFLSKKPQSEAREKSTRKRKTQNCGLAGRRAAPRPELSAAKQLRPASPGCRPGRGKHRAPSLRTSFSI